MADVTPAELFGTGWRTYRAYPGRVAIPAIIVFGTSAFGDTGLANWIDDQHQVFPWVFLALAIEAVAALGLTFYAGLLDRLVGAVEQGREPPPLSEVLRTLPWFRLIVADLLLLFVAGLASGLLLVPGLIVYSYFAIVGPLVNMEGHRVLGAFRRSAQLIRGNFWIALTLVTLPIFIEQEATFVTERLVHLESFWVIFVTHAVVGLVFGTVVGLLEVSLAERLVLAKPLELASHPAVGEGSHQM
jgi:hypothetical protein